MLRVLRVHVECVYMFNATASFYISLLAAAPAVTSWAHEAGQAAAILQLQLQTSDWLRSWFPLNQSDDLLLSSLQMRARGHAVVTGIHGVGLGVWGGLFFVLGLFFVEPFRLLL